MAMVYKNGAGNSSVGPQAITDYYHKKALIAIREKQYFMPLANVRAMPKNMGKKIKQDVYIPLLDDRNLNDQGIDAAGVASTVTTNGRLYGSSKDTGTIKSKIPALTENGGRVNRIGFTRQQIQGEIFKRGFFVEYTQESMDFDTDAELLSHITEEALVGANELTEAELQADLLNTASSTGTAYYMGGTSKASVAAVVTYQALMNLSIALDNNKTPKQTTVVTGSRMIDTKTIAGGRVMYIGSELIPAIEAMSDLHGNPAFIPVEKYAGSTTILNGEIGSVRQFRLVVVPEMQFADNAGAASADIYPMLVVGDEAFTTIGFQTDGKSVKFSINHKKPGGDIASLDDPYGETGFYSIKWYYGFMALRPERLGIIWTKAA